MKAFVDSPCACACAWIRALFPIGTRNLISSTFSFCHFAMARFWASLGAIISPRSYFLLYHIDYQQHIVKLHIYGPLYFTKFTIDIRAPICYSMYRKENNGSTRERQLPCACAGDAATYTTDHVRTALIVYPFPLFPARRNSVSSVCERGQSVALRTV